MALSLSKYYSVGVFGVYPFGDSDGKGKRGVGPRTTHLTFQKVDFWIDGGNFCHPREGNIPPLVINKTPGNIIYQALAGRIIMVLLVIM